MLVRGPNPSTNAEQILVLTVKSLFAAAVAAGAISERMDGSKEKRKLAIILVG
jgi:hypothetical protein